MLQGSYRQIDKLRISYLEQVLAVCEEFLALSTVRDLPDRFSSGTIPPGGRLSPSTAHANPRSTVSAYSMLLLCEMNIASLVTSGILPLTVASLFLLYLVLEHRAQRQRVKRTRREIEALHEQAAEIAQLLRRRAANADNAREQHGG